MIDSTRIYEVPSMCKTLNEALEYNEEQKEAEMITQTDVKLQPRMKERSMQQGAFLRGANLSREAEKSFFQAVSGLEST